MSNDHYHLEIDGTCLYCHIQGVFDKLKEIDGYNLRLATENFKLKREIEEMDKKIKALQKDTKKLAKKESSLLREDKKHDKVIDKAKKKMKGKC